MSTNISQAGQVPSMSRSQLINKTFLGILNKLVPENFETLMKQVDKLNINDEETLNTVIELIIKRVFLEPTYSATYAQMCHHLKELMVSSQSSDGFVHFHKRLLERCKMEFEKTGLGTVIFIGELFKLKMLKEAVIHSCIVKPINDKCDHSLVCLCKLLSIGGKGLDTEAERPTLNSYYRHICYLLKEKNPYNRIKLMLQDVVALRKTNWVPHRDDQIPKPIQQLHQDVKLAEKRERFQYNRRKTTKEHLPPQRSGGRLADRGRSTNVNVVPSKGNQDYRRDYKGERRQQGHLGSSSCHGINKLPVEQKTTPKQAESSSACLCNEEEMHQALKRRLQEKLSNDKIEERIQNTLNDRQRSSEGFVRALTRAVCHSVIVDCGVHMLNTYELLQRASLLKKYIKDAHKQLVALNVVQQLVVDMDQPDGLLRMFFDVLLDESVIQVETFFKWRSSTASSISVCRFFTLLQEANRWIN